MQNSAHTACPAPRNKSLNGEMIPEAAPVGGLAKDRDLPTVAAGAIPLLSCPRSPGGPFVKAHLAGGRMIGRGLSHEEAEALLARME